jgi:hypothetical protein
MKIWAKTKEFFEGKFLVVRRDGSVPHWPHFVLGARDPAAPRALTAYSDECRELGFDAAYCDSIIELAADFERYRDHEGLGDPDAAPHREDNPNVIEAMRGNRAIISVAPDKRNYPKNDEPA